MALLNCTKSCGNNREFHRLIEIDDEDTKTKKQNGSKEPFSSSNDIISEKEKIDTIKRVVKEILHQKGDMMKYNRYQYKEFEDSPKSKPAKGSDVKSEKEKVDTIKRVVKEILHQKDHMMKYNRYQYEEFEESSQKESPPEKSDLVSTASDGSSRFDYGSMKLQLIGKANETLRQGHRYAESSFSDSTWKDRADLISTSDQEEEEEELRTDTTDDATQVEWRRSSSCVDYMDTPWESDIMRRVNIQCERKQWHTNINPVQGVLGTDSWDTQMKEISKEVNGTKWSTSIHNISKYNDLHGEWETHIAKRLRNEELPVEWTSKLSNIEKSPKNSDNLWTTFIRNIKSHVMWRGEWKTFSNPIDSSCASCQTDWKVTLPKRSSGTTSRDSTWTTNINELERPSCPDEWSTTVKDCYMYDQQSNQWTTEHYNIQKCDQTSDWTTEHCKMQNCNKSADSWSTSFNKIAPSEQEEEITDLNTLPEYSTIPSSEGELDSWVLTIKDTPDNFSQSLDWTTSLNTTENHKTNRLWDSFLNRSVKDHFKRRPWFSRLSKLDMGKVDTNSWESSLNEISKTDQKGIQWDVVCNPIKNH